ncbi:MAG: SH3 domain-containing protein [Lachnospiraceae bacterium]|nr:SH3 domain-containing protein [Lachnospiraceae bacterium]
MPIAAGLCLFIIALIAVNVSGRKSGSDKVSAISEGTAAESGTASLLVDVPEVQLMKNAYPSVNSLIEKYYDAMASGDMEDIEKINSNVSETEKLRLQKMSEYIEGYDNIDVYTKVGPVANSYIAYVYSEVKFKDYDQALPGMQVRYICTGEDGTLYINEDEQEENITNYIREVSLQSDVVDLNNKVSVSYNDMLSKDPDLAAFLVQLTQDIDNSVGEELAAMEGTQSVAEFEANSSESISADGRNDGVTGADASQGIVATTPVGTVSKAKTITKVNVRSSDSENADKLGQAQAGEEFVVKNRKENGWTEIEYNGSTAYIRSDLLEDVEPETQNTQTAQNTENTGGNSTTTASSAANGASAGTTLSVSEAVSIRSAASTDSTKLGSAYQGDSFKVIQQRSDGWTEVEYKGSSAFIKSEFLH